MNLTTLISLWLEVYTLIVIVSAGWSQVEPYIKVRILDRVIGIGIPALVLINPAQTR